MTIWIADPPDRPATGTRWHSREDCPAIAGIGSPVRFSDLVKYGLDVGAKCRACDKRDRKAAAATAAHAAREGDRWRAAFRAEVARLVAKRLGTSVEAIETQAVEVADADAARRAADRAYVPANPRGPVKGDTAAEARAKTARARALMAPRAAAARPITPGEAASADAPPRSLLTPAMVTVPPEAPPHTTKHRRRP